MNKNVIAFATGLCLFALPAFAHDPDTHAPIKISSRYDNGSFPLVAEGKAAPLFVDPSEAPVIHIAAEAFQKDVERVTHVRPVLFNTADTTALKGLPVIIGTIGHSAWIEALINEKKLPVDSIRGQWESYLVAVVDHPFHDSVSQALVIVGSDNRGTAYGVFEISKRMGVSPWYWWADVHPEFLDNLWVRPGQIIQGPPAVKYRGIFLNDEDWGLQPWAAKHMDTTIKDIGPNTYAHIFELLLRLRANYIWPAMHSCTRAFFYYPGNAEMARKYAIIVGTSHCEPMLRNNLFEWMINYQNEYGKKPGEWRYDVNEKQIDHYWEDRIKEALHNQTTITVGMRNIHDGGMAGPPSLQGKVKLLEEIITNQRRILEKYEDRPADSIPQIFCPYKEVLRLYRSGLNLPDDITIVWADDNFGYIRQLSTPEEQRRSGGAGVYYHLSYWGDPHDYLWLSTQSPALISYEMSKAYHFGARRLWVFNVGDLKPAEMDINFAMDLAWDPDKWKPENAMQYTRSWAAQTFGEELADSIAAIKNEYYRLAAEGKPEHLGLIRYTDEQAGQRLADYQAMTRKAETLQKQVPQRLQDAYYELVLYPVKAACLMNEKILDARKSLELAKQGEIKALDYSDSAQAAYRSIEDITYTYNKKVAGGKWDEIMSWHPRDLEVFHMPPFANAEMVAEHSNTDVSKKRSSSDDSLPIAVIPAYRYQLLKDRTGRAIATIPGLGIDGRGITVLPFRAPVADSDHIREAPYAEYELPLRKGKHRIVVKCLPTNNVNQFVPVEYAISVNGDDPQLVPLSSEQHDWSRNVINGYSGGVTWHEVRKKGIARVRIYLPAPGTVVNEVDVY